ncbi:hypothetical protein [Glycomyces buryatensis]|uniref:MFS transporter n=1 Tax=Glycomyces buryatensis TaxID=2570927 RepID=A0A4S8QAQ1_9ACTN|nr:hypothetical protein [Glycomyces buryatensis]THV41408.1 hypothetical protein FAB82_11445 [Glycomyces buryatensis]
MTRPLRLLLVLFAAAGALVFMPSGANAQSAGDECTDYEWHTYWNDCVDELPEGQELDCEVAPQPATPQSGMAGWFAEPANLDKSEGIGTYSRYGYAGYQLPMYGAQEMSIGGSCVDSPTIPNGADTANALANMEFNVSLATVGAANSMRQAAWEPDRMWGWSNGFMETVSKVIFDQVFTVFGAVTVGVIGIYLLWRSRQADMNNAVTTVAWAALILVLVTAVVRWPVQAAQYTDEALKIGMNLSTTLISDDAAEGCERHENLTREEYEELKRNNRVDPTYCIDTRTAAVTASDTVSSEVLYQNWLRTMLGQSEEVTFERSNGEIVEENGDPVVRDSNTAYKYGPALFAAQAFSWTESQQAEQSAGERNDLIEQKQELWRNLVAQIQQEDPEAYSHLKGERAWERTGTGLLALLTAIMFALFDITASVLIILGFMIVRFAIVALPIIGTIALLRPAGGPFKRLVNTVLGAVINVAVFSIAAVVYIFAASRILGTSMPIWMQVVLIGMLGVAAWMLLRPFRRIAGLAAGGGPTDALLGRRGGGDNDSGSSGGPGGRGGDGSNGRPEGTSGPINDLNRNVEELRPAETAENIRDIRDQTEPVPGQPSGSGATTPESASSSSGSSGGGGGGTDVYRPPQRE